MAEQQSTLILPTEAIAEMRQMANDRSKANNIPSPRGAAEFDFQSKSSSPLTNDEIGSSNDDDVKQQQSTNLTQLSDNTLNHLSKQFLSQIISSAITMTEYCSRMTIQPADVAKAKELFVESFEKINNEESGEDWLLTEEEDVEDGEDEDMEAEVDTEGSNDDEHDDNDDALIYDDDDDEAYNDEEVYIDEERYPQNNGYTPKFDRVFAPVGEIVHLLDVQFKEMILGPLMIDVGVYNPLADGVDGMLKRALYAFVVASLCVPDKK